MKKSTPHTLFLLISLAGCIALCLLFGRMLLTYTVPMEDASYNLSLTWEGEAMPEDWEYDQKGWQVFTQEGTEITLLESDGVGKFTGLQYPGQTFYFSRPLTESLDSPTLRLDTANRSIAVFLDGKLLYTDHPELDNRIGYLDLPMMDYDRTDPVVLSLPPDYQGKILTIAQSTGSGELPEPEAEPTAWLCPVYLYCGYAYESELISESFRIAIPAAIGFCIGTLLLVAFLWQLFSEKPGWSLPFLSLTVFLWSTWQITTSSFANAYFGILPVDIASLSRLFSLTILLGFLMSRLSGKRKFACGIFSALHAVVTLFAVIPDINQRVGFLWQSVPESLGLVGLIAISVCMAWEWKKDNLFSRFFCPLMASELLIALLLMITIPSLRQRAGQQLVLGAQGYFLWKLMALAMSAAILSALSELIAGEIAHRTETKLLAQRYELAQSGFENLRHHHEETMMLRHDMKKHLTFLRQSTSDKTTLAYLEELIGQQDNISQIVQSRNQTLDIILNAKLGEADKKGIKVEIVQSDAPESLPLTDAELCALIMNLLDNAIQAASHAEFPLLQLSMHQKDDFFIFVCENTVKSNSLETTTKKEPVSKHGLGLKIVNQIVKQYGDLMDIEHLPNSYRVTIAIPLDQSRK